MPLHGSLKKVNETVFHNQNRASCLRTRHNNKDSVIDSKSSSPAISPLSSRRSSCEEIAKVSSLESSTMSSNNKTSKQTKHQLGKKPSTSPSCSQVSSTSENVAGNTVVHSCSLQGNVNSSQKAIVPQPNKELKNLSSDTQLTLVVEGSHFTVERSLFSSKPDTMLAEIFNGCGVEEENWGVKLKDNGEYEITDGISACVFKTLLEYYATDKVVCPPGVSVAELRNACEFFLIPFNHETVRCNNIGAFMHELSNDGARLQFRHFFDKDILPLMAKVAQRGDRECHIVVLTDEDTVEWDLNFPPQMGEEYAKTVSSTPLHRFLRYIENREVAKLVLKDKGLKKIRLGIEGYPISMDKVKRRSSGRQDVIYDYVQRSFIAVSWEKEGSKSRHVDFQCVSKSKSITNLVAAAADTPQDHGLLIQAEADLVDGLPNVAARDQMEDR